MNKKTKTKIGFWKFSKLLEIFLIENRGMNVVTLALILAFNVLHDGSMCFFQSWTEI